MTQSTDGRGNILTEGCRVYAYDLFYEKFFGILLKNSEYPEVSEWYIKYDDGLECAVLDIDQVFLVV